MEAHFYNTNIEWKRDRIGILSSPELSLQFEVATPPQFAKGVEGIWSPEHLLTASVASCFMTTFLAIAENSKLDFSAFSCKAKGKLDTAESKLQITEVILFPSVKILQENDKEKAERIIKKSEAACLISNSVKAKIILQPEIIIQ